MYLSYFLKDLPINLAVLLLLLLVVVVVVLVVVVVVVILVVVVVVVVVIVVALTHFCNHLLIISSGWLSHIPQFKENRGPNM